MSFECVGKGHSRDEGDVVDEIVYWMFTVSKMSGMLDVAFCKNVIYPSIVGVILLVPFSRLSLRNVVVPPQSTS